MNKPQERLMVALDTPDLKTARRLLKELEGVVTFYKIGFELFTAYGWEAVEAVKKSGARVFLDLKLHDIPNTVSKTAAVICRHGVDLFNVHALGGFEMMWEVRKSVDQSSPDKTKKPRILAVTILTSHTEENLMNELGIQRSLADQVLHLARLAKKAGLDGVVSSPVETSLLRKEFGPDFLIVTPGVRPKGTPADDQKRIHTPGEAISQGANYIIVGRPITEASSPREAALNIFR